VKIIPYEPTHYLTLSRGIYARWPEGSLPSPAVLAEQYALAGPGFTVLDADGEPVACAGVIRIWHGLGQAWAIVGPGVIDHRRAHFHFHRAARRIFAHLCRRYGWRMVLAYISAGSERDARWAAQFGFRCQTRLDEFGPGGEAFELWTWRAPHPVYVADDGHLMPAIMGGYDAVSAAVLLYAGIAAAAVSTGTALYSASQAASQARAQSKRAGEIAAYQTQVAQQQKQLEQARLADRQRRILAAQRVGYGAAGVSPEGTPLDVALQTVEESNYDAAIVAYNAALRGQGIQVGAQTAQAEAEARARAAELSMIGTVAAGVGQAATGYRRQALIERPGTALTAGGYV
jgi:hypothetical protein